MRRILTGLIAGTVAVAATISPVQASSESGLSSLGSSGGYLSSGVSSDAEAEDSGEEFAATSSGDDLTIAIAVLATGGIIAAGMTWAVQQRLIANPLPGIIPGPPAVPAPAQRPAAPAPAPASRSYGGCTDVWNDLGRPIMRGEPGYLTRFDGDNDGIGCERDPR